MIRGRDCPHGEPEEIYCALCEEQYHQRVASELVDLEKREAAHVAKVLLFAAEKALLEKIADAVDVFLENNRLHAPRGHLAKTLAALREAQRGKAHSEK